jgi:hypothetical protein
MNTNHTLHQMKGNSIKDLSSELSYWIILFDGGIHFNRNGQFFGVSGPSSAQRIRFTLREITLRSTLRRAFTVNAGGVL